MAKSEPAREAPKGLFARLAFWLFGTASRSRDVTWVPGNGRHGR